MRLSSACSLPVVLAGLATTLACGVPGQTSSNSGAGDFGGEAGDGDSGAELDSGASVGKTKDDPAACVAADDGVDRLDPDSRPPCGLEVDEVPLFVSLGFDDNAYTGFEGSQGEGGMRWILDVLADRQHRFGPRAGATPLRQTFFNTSTYAGTWMAESPTLVKRAWREAYEAGHEIGNHTHNHPHGQSLGRSEWLDEMQRCVDWLTRDFVEDDEVHTPNDDSGVGVDRAEILGFRTPYLEYNAATLEAVQELGFWYDCSIEDGWQPGHDGTNYHWPYTLHEGSPGHEILVDWGSKEAIGRYPGLWELPVHPVIVPPDEECERYGVKPGLRDKFHELHDWFDVGSGKITGFDYNLWVQFEMTGAEFLATLKYTLDLRVKGNRAPFLFGTHSDQYSSKYMAAKNASLRERQKAIEDFLDYALDYEEVRIAPYAEVLAWMRNPEKR